jgi:hypothetical protein
MKYMVTSNSQSRIVELSRLSRSLEIGCEIFDESGANYIGLVSDKVLLYLIMEISRYSYENFAKPINGKIKKVEVALSLCSNWIKDPDSTLIVDIDGAGFDCYPDDFNVDHISPYPEEFVQYPEYNVMVSVASLCSALYFIQNNRQMEYLDHLEAVCYNAAKANKDKTGLEYERQGSFIIVFLKSGKSLFL